MGSSPRWRLACDTCETSAWVGASATRFDAWCEACQRAQSLAAAPDASARCNHCCARLFAAPRFVELWGSFQQLDAVLAAWAGDPMRLAMLLPERPVFLTDLSPPAARPDDPPALRALLAAVARGDWRATLAARAGGARADAARAIALERMSEPAAAIAAWDAVLAAGEDPRARLARGSLRARAGRWEEAEADLALAGDSFAARWSRAALIVTAAVHGRAGMPDAGALARARAEAGEPSAYWSDPTVGRLLWSRLVSRTLAAAPRRAGEAARARLRRAEAELEHDTFWDRELVLVGWVRVGVSEEAVRVAQALARSEAHALAVEPALGGAPLGDVARALDVATRAIATGEPALARRALAAALGRDDLRRFRLPCTRCGRGSIGVEEIVEAVTAAD